MLCDAGFPCSAKVRKVKAAKSFIKIFDPSDNSRRIAVVNLNYMFPVPGDGVKALGFKVKILLKKANI